MTAQYDRVYELIIGDYKANKGFVITDLEVSFNIKKTSSNTNHPDSCEIKIYNLSRDTLKYFESEYISAKFSAGYRLIGAKYLFSGQVTYIHTKKQGTDRVTEIRLGAEYVGLNHTNISTSVPPGRIVKDVIEKVRINIPGVSKGVYSGQRINSQISNGYPMSGSPRQILDQIARAYEIEWRIDNSVLYVNDMAGVIDINTTSAPLISKTTGLIDSPYYSSGDKKKKKLDPVKKVGIEFTCLLNASIKPGSWVKVEDESINGFYKVDSVHHTGDFRGQSWYSKVFCSTVG